MNDTEYYRVVGQPKPLAEITAELDAEYRRRAHRADLTEWFGLVVWCFGVAVLCWSLGLIW
jgi:hypothetical protein